MAAPFINLVSDDDDDDDDDDSVEFVRVGTQQYPYHIQRATEAAVKAFRTSNDPWTNGHANVWQWACRQVNACFSPRWPIGPAGRRLRDALRVPWALPFYIDILTEVADNMAAATIAFMRDIVAHGYALTTQHRAVSFGLRVFRINDPAGRPYGHTKLALRLHHVGTPGAERFRVHRLRKAIPTDVTDVNTALAAGVPATASATRALQARLAAFFFNVLVHVDPRFTLQIGRYWPGEARQLTMVGLQTNGAVVARTLGLAQPVDFDAVFNA
jgi:hypothetical protein